MSSEDRFFCSLESKKNGEEILGTVARIRSWFLLEYPGVWRRNALEDSRLIPPVVRKHILGKGWDRCLLIRQGHTWDCEELSAFEVRSSPDSLSVTRHRLANYEQIPNLSGPGEITPGLMFAVCTHSRHDRCCAKFGNAVWCALRDAAPDRAWQCSHVGGDRFAANVVLLPHGIYYGRVLPEHVDELIRTSDRGEIWLPGFRGRSCYSRPAQIADCFLRRESGLLAFDDFQLSSTDANGTKTAVTFVRRADESRHKIEYATVPGVLRQRLTCEAEDESSVSQHRLLSYTVER